MNLRAIQRAFDVRRYLDFKFGQEQKEYPPNIAVKCPVCEKDGKLWVLTEDKAGGGAEAGSWICYYCGDGGNRPLSLIQRVEQCDLFHALEVMTTYQKDGVAVTDLRELVLQTLSGIENIEVEWDDTPLHPMKLPFEFIPWEREDQKVPAFFKERKISFKRAQLYGMGWCEEGYYANRLIVPVKHFGDTVFWIARWMANKPPEGVKKTIYPKGASVNHVLYNYERAFSHEQIVLVEDVFSAQAVGPNGVATFGTAFSQYQLKLLLATHAKEVVILWDRDATVRHTKSDDTCKKRRRGKVCADCNRYEKTQKLAARLADFWNVRVVQLPDARDPKAHTRESIRKMIAEAEVMTSASSFRSLVTGRLKANAYGVKS
jgi:hypothetical protein